MSPILPTGDGDKASKKGNFLNGSGNNNPVLFQRDKSKDLRIQDIIKDIRTPRVRDDILFAKIATAFKKRPSLAEKMYRVEGTHNAMTLGEIALDFNRPVLAQQINNLREGLVYKRQAQESRLHKLHTD